MEIHDAKIVKVNLKRCVVCITFEYIYGKIYYEFDLSNPIHKKYVLTLLAYAKTDSFEKFEGKSVRVLIKNRNVIGFGDSIFDKFFEIFNGKFEELTAKRIFERVQ